MAVKYSRLNWLLAASLALGAAACGDDDDGPGDDGGVSIDGNVTVDAAKLCGNGRVDTGEQCDDGNQSNNDSCSTQCRTLQPPVNSCDPTKIVNMNTVGVQDGFVTSFVGTLDDGASDIEPPMGCALAGSMITPGMANNRVHKYTLGVKADLLITLDNAGTPDLDSVMYVTSSCMLGQTAMTAQCNDDGANGVASELFLEAQAPGDYFIVVDAYNAEAAMTPDYQLDIIVRPVVAAAAGCDTRAITNRCDTGLTCRPSAAGSLTGTCMTGARPVLSSVLFTDLGNNNAGVVLKGTDTDGDVTGYQLELLNSGGTPIALTGGITSITRGFDQDLTGLTTWRGSEQLGLGTTLGPMTASIRVRALDAAGLMSDPLTIAKSAPAMVAAGLACETDGRENVCTTGLVCQGTPSATCQTPAAPVVDATGTVALTLASGARRLVVNASDADGDASRLVVTFLDAANATVMVDGDGSGAVESPSIFPFSQVIGAGSNPTLIRRELAMNLFAAAPGSTITQADIQVRDAGMRLSNTVRVSFNALPTPADAAACDPRRYLDECAPAATQVCSGNGTAGTCGSLAAAQTAACTSPPALTLGTAVTGTITTGPDRWSPSCDNPASGGSEKVYSLAVPALSDLRVSTDFPETDIDSLIYVTSNCGATLTELGCTDDVNIDAGNFKTDGFISNVPAGNVFVIVDSYNVLPNVTGGAGNFKLNVTQRTISASGAACDPVQETSRCATGLRCKPNATFSAFTCGN
ncbi:MAG: hypothetical protein IT370_36990 [Deltaproteobacteria bacterium]|nr:hypothetical protein [Deltaproteobacteria bacterium]